MVHLPGLFMLVWVLETHFCILKPNTVLREESLLGVLLC